MPQIEFNLPLPNFLISSKKRRNSRKKKIKEKKPWSLKKRLIVSSIIFLVTFSILILLGTTPDQWTNFYFYNLNPKAGAVQLEGEYKKNFQAADTAMQNANDAIDYTAKNAKNSNELAQGDNKAQEYFGDRDAAFSEMIRIDKLGLGLNLPKDYKEFYKKRLIADTNDYNAFKVYSTGEKGMMDGILAMEQFYDQYDLAYSQIQYFAIHGLEPTHVNQFNATVLKVNEEYQNIAGMADTSDIFTNDILNYIQTSYESINLFRQLNDAITNNDQQKAQNIMTQLSNLTSTSTPDIYVLIGQWYKDKVVPTGIQQDTMHKKSWSLYKQAYLYAKDEHLNDLLKVWGNNAPGTESNSSPAVPATTSI